MTIAGEIRILILWFYFRVRCQEGGTIGLGDFFLKLCHCSRRGVWKLGIRITFRDEDVAGEKKGDFHYGKLYLHQV